VLREAVFDAALAEIAEKGVRGATMDGIARRAGTGKSALYRRWPNVRALAMDVFLTTMQQQLPADAPDTGSLRDDLLVGLDRLATALDGDLGVVLRELVSEAAHDPALGQEFQERLGTHKETELIAIIQRAMARGEIPVHPIDPTVLQVPAAMVVHRLVITGHPPTQAELAHILDVVILPLLRVPVTV
jgi:AcrR family transcriptional regulator